MATLAALARPFEAARNRSIPAELPAALLGVAVVTPVASANGGWDATSWGWIVLALVWVAVVGILLRPSLAFGLPELVVLGALGAFSLWTLVSASWSGDKGGSVLTFERTLVYVAAIAAVLVVVRRAGVPHLLASVWLGASLVCGYALVTRLYPNRFPAPLTLAGNRLEQPIGYWNGLGLLAAVALAAGIGVIASTRSRTLAGLVGLSVVPVVLALYFTFSRGGFLALGVAVVVLLALDANRLRAAAALVALAVPAALAVSHASHVSALTSVATDPATASLAGARLVRAELPYAALALVAALAIAEGARRIEAGPRVHRVGNAVLAVGALAAVVAGVALLSSHYGSPTSVVRQVWHSFSHESGTTPTNLNDRLFTFSGTGRVALWRVAWADFRGHPLTGSGAGTYQRFWLRNRPGDAQAVNAHNLYAETLAELGVVGLALLLVALVVPLAAAWRARGRPAVGAAAAVYAAFVVHSFFDWDWQLPGVALGPVLLGAALLVAGRDDSRQHRPGRLTTAGAVAALALVAGVSLWGLLANRAVADANRRAARDNLTAAVASAGHARRLEPWSSEPWRIEGEAELSAGLLNIARHSFQQGIARNRDSWRLWLDLALATPDPAGRLAAARQALALNPHSDEIAAVRTSLGLPPPKQP
ncbi:MAG TPA: O-antigen ligase family protein [Gaiellaceae bacterium]|nr:O-antigen ligase family protein [Gaiellaceae bacterium]